MSSTLPHILVIEESSDDLLLIQRAFRKCNLAYPVITIRDGEEAIAYLSGSGPYHDRNIYPLPGLILVSWRLPRKSGLEVLQWVRQQPALADLPVVMLSSAIAPADVTRALAAGADHCLSKPIGHEVLVSVLARVNLHRTHLPARAPGGTDTSVGRSPDFC